MSDFEKTLDFVENCQIRYKEEFISHMKQRSAEAQQRSAEFIKNIMKNDSIWLKKSMIEFYNMYSQNPNIVKKEDIDFAREATNTIISDCKKYGINYRAVLQKEVGDSKKVDAILRFYGVE